jgi:hypothetical protein
VHYVALVTTPHGVADLNLGWTIRALQPANSRIFERHFGTRSRDEGHDGALHRSIERFAVRTAILDSLVVLFVENQADGERDLLSKRWL